MGRERNRTPHASRVELLEARTFLSNTPSMMVPLHGAYCWCAACCGGASTPVQHAPVQELAASTSSSPATETSSTLAVAAPQTPRFSVKVDFRPATATGPLPSGYRFDTGAAYAKRANGLTYGWNANSAANMRERKEPISPDSRYDTIAKMPDDATWSIKVPDGWYQVNLYAGDPRDWQGSDQVMDVQGKLALNGKPMEDYRFVEGVVRTEVRNGKLTIRSSAEGENNALGFVHIRQVDPPPSYRVTDDLDWHTTSATTPVGRVEAGVVRVGDKLYIMGGYTNGYDNVLGRVDILDIKTGRWSRGASLPGAQTHFGAASDGRYIYVVAGQYGAMFSRAGTNEAWRYDTLTDTWSAWRNLPVVRFGGALASLDGSLYFYGGAGADRVDSSSKAWRISTTSRNPQWTPIANMPQASDHLGHAVIDGEIYAIGGEHDHNISYIQHSEVYSYNPATNTWRQRASMPTPSSHFEGAVVERDDKLWVIAGQIDAQQLTDEVRVYDPKADRWTLHTPFPEKRKGGAAYIYQNTLYYLTGDSLANGQPRTVIATPLPELA